MNVYPKDFLQEYDIIDKSFFTGGEIDAKKERDTLARQLRKDGWIVKTKKWYMPDISNKDCYTLYATKRKRDNAILFEQKITALQKEFSELKLMLFGSESFVIYQNDDLQKRYDQLLGFFKPEFRYKNWVNPLEES